jgi:hypothetical protein
VKALFKGYKLQLRGDENKAMKVSTDGGRTDSPAGITSSSGTATGGTVQRHKKITMKEMCSKTCHDRQTPIEKFTNLLTSPISSETFLSSMHNAYFHAAQVK